MSDNAPAFQKDWIRWAALFLFHAWIVIFSGIIPALTSAENSRPAFYNDPDKTLNTCILQWNLKSLENKWNIRISDAPIFYPCRYAKFFSEHLFAHMIYAAPVSLIDPSPEVVYNVTYQFNRLTIGIAASLLCLEIGSAFLPALLAGGLLITSWKFGQIQNTGLCWSLLAILFFIRQFKKPSWTNALLFTLFMTLTGLSSGYLAFYTPLSLLLMWMVHLIYTRRLPESKWTAQMIVAGILIGMALAPTMVGYKIVQEKYGLVRQDYHVAQLILPTVKNDQRTVEGQEQFALTGIASAEVFLSVGAIVLIAFRRLKFGGWEFCFVVLAVLSFWMAFFEFSPYALIARLPGFNGLRAAYRWYFLWIAAVTVLVSMVFTAINAKLQKVAKIGFIAVAATLLIYTAIPDSQLSNTSGRLPESHVYSFLATLPSGPICILPVQARGRLLYRLATADRMLYQLPYSYSMLSGYSGYVPPITRLIENKLIANGLTRPMLMKLARTGIKYVVVDNLLGNTSAFLGQLRSQPDCKILFDQNDEMIAELPARPREEDMEKLLEMWKGRGGPKPASFYGTGVAMYHVLPKASLTDATRSP